MSRVTLQLRTFAQRLVACEEAETKAAGMGTPASFQACERLRPHLITLMGKGGFRGLLARSLALAVAEAPKLGGIRLKVDGSIEGLEELREKLTPSEFQEVGLLLLASLLGLLVAFVGEKLTLRLVREVWPKVPLHSLSLESTDKK